MAFDKITADDTNGKGVVGLPDTPQLDTTSMQKKFDELATDVIIPKFNQLIDELSGDNAASSTGAQVPDGLQADANLQSILQALHDDTQTRQPKETGKGLSANDYSDEEKRKVVENTESRHSHANKSILDVITGTVKAGYDRVVGLFAEITTVSKTIEATDESIPTGKAIVDYVQSMGGGDMLTAMYDPDKDGKVVSSEVSDNAKKLGGYPPEYYLSYQRENWIHSRNGGPGSLIYDGEYSITPQRVAQVLDTGGKMMTDDVTVKKIPRYDVANESGTTVIIGDDEYGN